MERGRPVSEVCRHKSVGLTDWLDWGRGEGQSVISTWLLSFSFCCWLNGGAFTKMVGAKLPTATWTDSLSLLSSGKQFRKCVFHPSRDISLKDKGPTWPSKAGLRHIIHAGTGNSRLRTIMGREIGDRSTPSPGGLRGSRGGQVGTTAAGYMQHGCVWR